MDLGSKCVLVREGSTANSGSSIENANVLAVNYGDLFERYQPSTDNPVKCIFCDAYVSHVSKIENKKWICDFCGKSQEINYHFAIPRDEVNTYVLQGECEPSIRSLDDKIVIYCIDTSGSMGESTNFVSIAF